MAGDSSYVALELGYCVVCDREMETGSLLLNMRLKDIPEDKRNTGRYAEEPCPGCKEHLNGGERVALVGIDEEKSREAFLPGGTVDPRKVWRTGHLMFIRREAWERIFDIPCPPKMAFMDPQVFEMLQPHGDGVDLKPAIGRP